MDTDGVRFHYHRGLLMAFAVGAVALMALGTILFVTASPSGSDVPKGVFIIGFFGLVLIFVARVWYDRDPVVEINVSGIRDRRIGDQTIPWNAISAVRGYGTWDNRLLKILRFLSGFSKAGNRFLGIIVDDPDRFYRPPNPFVRVLGRFNLLVGYPLLSINMGPLDGTYEDLVAAVGRFAEGKAIDISA